MIVLTDDIKSNVGTSKRGSKKLSSFLRPEGFYPAKDNDGSKITAPTVEQTSLCKFNEHCDFMPTFNLLEEEPEKGFLTDKVEDDECKIITGRTIFDHIRKKAKDFPRRGTSNGISSLSLEAVQPIAKRIHEKSHEPYGVIEITEEIEGNENQQKITACSIPETVNIEDSGNAINGGAAELHTVPGSLDIRILMDGGVQSIGTLSTQPEEDLRKSNKVEAIFEHIRKKSRNFPAINKSNTMELDSVIPSRPHSTNVIVLDTKPSEAETHAAHRTFDLPFEAFNVDSNQPFFKNPTPKSSLSKKDMQFEPQEAAAETEKVDSFLGFKSVFSFL